MVRVAPWAVASSLLSAPDMGDTPPSLFRLMMLWWSSLPLFGLSKSATLRETGIRCWLSDVGSLSVALPDDRSWSVPGISEVTVGQFGMTS